MTSEVKVSPKPGQFWVRSMDTCLCYVEAFYPGEIHIVHLKTWSGGEDQPVVYILPCREFVWLWHETHIDRAQIPWNAKPGDIGMHMPTRQAFFIGPDTDRGLVQVLSDWDCTKEIQLGGTHLFYAAKCLNPEGIELTERLENPLV